MIMYWEKDIETLEKNQLQQLQSKRLMHTINQAAQSPFYKKVFKKYQIDTKNTIKSSDISKLPFTTKQDLRENYPYGLMTVDQKEVIRLHCSSGTTGNPIVVFHTRHDINAWSNLMARSLFSTGVRDTDVFQNICGYGLFTGGLGFQYGAETLGCLSIPAGAGNTARQIKLMQDYGTTTIHAIPSYLNRLHDFIVDSGMNPQKDLKLRKMMIGAEPYSKEQQLRIEDMFGIKVYNSYGLTEMNGPGVAFECECQSGLHIWEDAFIVEIINPETLEPVADGEVGELVMTTLDRQAVPIIRFRSRDLTRIIPGKCECGRTHRRIDRITGRTDDMFIVKGCNIFPMQIEAILLQVPEVASNYMIKLETINDNSEMIIEVEVMSNWFRGDIARLERLRKQIEHSVRNEVLVKPIIRMVEAGSLPVSEGKAVRVQDLRKLN
jgi:phenylacetate-CoA ligase